MTEFYFDEKELAKLKRLGNLKNVCQCESSEFPYYPGYTCEIHRRIDELEEKLVTIKHTATDQNKPGERKLTKTVSSVL